MLYLLLIQDSLIGGLRHLNISVSRCLIKNFPIQFNLLPSKRGLSPMGLSAETEARFEHTIQALGTIGEK